MTKIYRAFAILIVFALTACLEFHEIVQLKADGSAELSLQIKVPQFPKKAGDEDKDPSKEAQDLIEGLSGSLRLVKKDKSDANGVTIFRVVVAMDSLNQVKDLYQKVRLKESDPKKQQEKKGKDEFEQLFIKSHHFQVSGKGADTLTITRSFTPPKIAQPKPEKKDADKEKFGKEFEEVLLNSFYFTFEFIPPADVTSSNASWVVADSYRWETCLGYLLKNPFKMEIQIPMTPELKTRYGKK